jgi:nucleolar protein 56
MQEMRALGNSIIALYVLKEEFEKYQADLAKEIAPNISELAGADLAAKLIAHAGSLEKLAKMPASTVQVIGAEKALFKHLRNRKIAPPKHGLIFQYARIQTAPREIRGKIARALAAKIAIASKADMYTKNFIAPQLKADFEKRYAEIISEAKGNK